MSNLETIAFAPDTAPEPASSDAWEVNSTQVRWQTTEKTRPTVAKCYTVDRSGEFQQRRTSGSISDDALLSPLRSDPVVQPWRAHVRTSRPKMDSSILPPGHLVQWSAMI